MLDAIAVFDRATSDLARDHDSKSIDSVAGAKSHNPNQQVEHGTHRASFADDGLQGYTGYKKHL
jgi:hypothetical protein